MRTTLAVITAVLAAAAVQAQWEPGKGTDVTTTIPGQGPIIGKHDPDEGVNYFLSVPYAASTAGENRFQPPKARAPWTTPLNTTDYGIATSAGCHSDHHNPDTDRQATEDCLGMDIYAPSEATPDSKLPVLVWFYGGSFEEGFAEGPFNVYNGVYLASTHKVVVAAVNYRLGPLGFATIQSVGVEGNMGLKDQQFAMKWVQNNIHLFGGDPSQVTIWGESAGAMSVGIHLVSPESKGLFSRAIMESNVALRYQDQSTADELGMDFCKDAGCTYGTLTHKCNLTCLQEQPWDTIEHAWSKSEGDAWIFIKQNLDHLIDGILPFKPVVDGKLLPDQVNTLLDQGKMNDADVMSISNTGEAWIFVYPVITIPVNWIEYVAFLDVVFGIKNSASIRGYPEYKALANDTDERDVISQELTDYLFRCPSEQFAVQARKMGRQSWTGLYAHLYHGLQGIVPYGLPEQCTEHVCHATELPFSWHNTASSVGLTFTSQEEELSRRMVDRWMSFAKTGNPNTVPSPSGLSRIEWPAFDATNRSSLRLNLQDTVDPTSQHLCASFWDVIGYDH